MKLKIVRYIVGLLFSILLAPGGVSVGFAKGIQGITQDTIKIGSIADQTGSAAIMFRMIAKGHRNYFRYINDQGGINGRKIKYLLEDDHYQIPETLACFKKLMFKDRVFTFMGGGSTAAVLMLKKRAEKHRVPYLATTTAEAVVIPPARYMFNLGATYEDEIRVIFHYLVNVLRTKDLRLGIVHLDTKHGKVGLREAKRQARLYDVELVENQILSMRAMEANSQVLNMRRKNVNCVIIHHVSNSGAVFIRDAIKYNYHPDVIGTKWMCTDDLIRMTGKALENFAVDALYSSWYDETPGCAEMRDVTLGYYPGKEKSYSVRTYTMGWTDATIVAEGLKRAGKHLTQEGLVQAMESMENFDTRGLCGPVTFGHNDRKATEYCRIYKPDFLKGIFIPFTDWLKPGLQKTSFN
ncbi:MAG: ABC transporter substrate-binding protein [Thermodesulfobacteriota bacterium]|nr:ABC transporter substrate-binding protein [Thermodesulfobacteriota bacterium]